MMLRRLRLRIPLLALVVALAAGAGCGESPITPTPPVASLGVTGFQPATGNIYGGTRVIVNGSGFDSGTLVFVGGVPAVNHIVLSSTQLMVTTPAHTAGPAAIAMTNGRGESVTASAMFMFAAAALRSFEDPSTGFTTTELRDAQDQVLHLDQDGFLVFPDGTPLPGFRADARYISVPSGCQCALEVRFGKDQGQQRAYLTADYGHYNPGTLVILQHHDYILFVAPTGIYPPGTLMLSGTITELTDSGESPVEGVIVELPVFDGYRDAKTNGLGAYEVRGLIAGRVTVTIAKPGYETLTQVIDLDSDRRLDARLRRR